MRKITFLLSMLFVVLGLSAQTNLVQNPSFETWSGGKPDSWVVPANSSHAAAITITQEATIKTEGASAMKLVVDATQNPGFQQVIPITAGKTYQLSMDCYVVSGDGTDTRIWSTFKNAAGFYNTAAWTAATTADPNLKILQPNEYTVAANGVWVTVALEFKAPADATDFVFEFRTYKNATVIYDNASLKEKATTAPSITVNPETVALSAAVGASATQTVTVTGANLTAAPTYALSGANASLFAVTGTLTAAGGSLEVKYSPTSIAENSATLTITGNGVTKTVALTGTGTDPNVATYTFDMKKTLDPFTPFSKVGDQVWVADATYGAKMSGYDGTASNANEDWLISPAFDLSTGYESAKLNFSHAINKGVVDNVQTNHTLWVTTNYTSGDPATANWTQVPIPNYPPGNNWTFVESGEIVVPAALMVANVRFAFKYLSTAADAATWEITPITVTVKKLQSSVHSVRELKMFTSEGKINFQATAGETIEVYNTVGQRLHNSLATDGLNTIDAGIKGVAIVKVGNRVGKVVL